MPEEVRGHTWSSRPKSREELEARYERRGECLVWTGATTPHGYGQSRIAGKPHVMHRLMYEWHVGPIPEGMFVLHRCDNAPCGEPSHLFLGTQADNMADAVRKGRIAERANHSQAKLTEEQVLEIRQRLAQGETTVSIGAAYGVARATVGDIKCGRTWID